jgi:hypothetical protein
MRNQKPGVNNTRGQHERTRLSVAGSQQAAHQTPAVTGTLAVAGSDLGDRARSAGPGILAGAASAVKIAVAAVAPLICGLAILGGIGSFATVRHLATPWFGANAWIVPVGVDIGILALLAWDLLAEYLGIPWPILRWTAWAFIAATVYLNITAARGDPAASIMHAAMPILFVTVIEGIRHLIRQWTGLATGTRIEHIPVSRWLLAPRYSFLLFRRMVLWHVTSYRQGLTLEYQRLQAIARLQQVHGHYLWRWRAPLGDRLALRPAPVEETARAIANPAETAPSARVRSLLPRHCLIAPPASTTQPLSGRDRRLVETARAIIRQAEAQGRRISQAALARQMRAQGQPVANERLRWLMTAAGTGPSRERPAA